MITPLRIGPITPTHRIRIPSPPCAQAAAKRTAREAARIAREEATSDALAKRRETDETARPKKKARTGKAGAAAGAAGAATAAEAVTSAALTQKEVASSATPSCLCYRACQCGLHNTYTPDVTYRYTAWPTVTHLPFQCDLVFARGVEAYQENHPPALDFELRRAWRSLAASNRSTLEAQETAVMTKVWRRT